MRVETDTKLETVGASTDEFSHSVGDAHDESWYRILDLFQDASIFQTVAFCRAKMPGARLEEVVVRRGSDVAAAALVRVVPIPFLRTSIAYVLWGPMFHRHDGTRDGTALA